MISVVFDTDFWSYKALWINPGESMTVEQVTNPCTALVPYQEARQVSEIIPRALISHSDAIMALHIREVEI